MNLGLNPAGPTERILWIVLVLIVAAYFGGTWLNRQRSKAIGKWLQAGIGLLGGRVAWRWIRGMNSGAEVTVAETRPPFRQVQLAYFMLTREFPPLWAIELLRHKGDLLSIKADLRSVPARELEVVPLHGQLRSQLDKDGDWQWQELAAGLGLGTRGATGAKGTGPVTTFLNTYGPYVERLSIRKRTPHVVLFLRLPGPEARPADDLLRALQKLLTT
jgi:hypothetical protein